jgi:hypothetical protein
MEQHRFIEPSSSRSRLIVPVALALAAWVVLPVTQAESTVGAAAIPRAQDVDLALSSNLPAIAPGATGVHALRVINNGAADFAGPVAATYVTPTYLNVDHTKPLPGGCTMRLTEPDPTVPEVVTCRITKAIAAGKDLSIDIPVVVTTRVRLVGRLRGMAIATPATESGHSDVDLGDNWNPAQVTISRPTPKTPEGNLVDLYQTNAAPALSNDQPGAVTVNYGNKGPRDMLGNVQITYVTPFYVNVDHSKPLPRGCVMRLTDPDPLIPEIVVCTLKPLKAKATASVAIPLKLVPGAPLGPITGTSLVAPPSVNPVVDVERSQVDNVIPSTIVNINPPTGG